MQPKSKEYKALEALWDKKLASSGFKDIEQRDGNLKIWHSFIMPRRLGTVRCQIQAEYYSQAATFLLQHVFANATEHKIWQLHSEGVPIREIGRQVKRSKADPKSTVYNVINRLRKIMVVAWSK